MRLEYDRGPAENRIRHRIKRLASGGGGERERDSLSD